ncbi:MAG: hypothetical protein ACRDY2_09430 [Acidimicrobiales bacterium]
MTREPDPVEEQARATFEAQPNASIRGDWGGGRGARPSPRRRLVRTAAAQAATSAGSNTAAARSAEGT